MEIAIRKLTAADLDAADRIYQAAFGRKDSRKPELVSYLKLEPEGWLFATLDDEPTAFVGTINYGPFAYIGMMCVCPEMQRRGVGRALLERLLAWLDERGCPLTMLDATAAGVPLYLKLGFTYNDEMYTCHWQRHLPPGVSVAQVEVLKPDDLPALVAFDTPIFGANRQAIFADYVTRFPQRAFITRDDAGQISGYIFAQARRIGPWVARHSDDAKALLDRALALDYEDFPILAAPGANPAVIEMLRRYGFTVDGPWRHMIRGQGASPIRYEMIYGLASYTLG